jgi:hypothetical protein
VTTLKPAHYEIGRPDEDACCCCLTLHQVIIAAPTLAPGSYWVDEITPGEPGPSAPYGVLHVRSQDDWNLRSLGTLRAGPGYLIV